MNCRLLTRKKTAELLSCSVRTVDRLIKDKKLQAVKFGLTRTSSTRVKESSLFSYINGPAPATEPTPDAAPTKKPNRKKV